MPDKIPEPTNGPAPGLLADAINLASRFDRTLPPTDAAACARLLVAIDNLRRAAAAHREDLEVAMHGLIEGETLILDGLGGFTKTHASKRTAWDTNELRRRVLDSRRMVTGPDPATGEIITTPMVETELDKILHVWNLGAPRTTALAERGIDRNELDEYSTVEYGRPTIKVTPAEANPIR